MNKISGEKLAKLKIVATAAIYGCLNSIKDGTVFFIYKDKNEVTEAKIAGFCFKGYESFIVIHSDKPSLDFEAIKLDDKLFATREAAEKHLLELTERE